MKVKRIISESKYKRRREVIAKDGDTLQTLHIHRKSKEWRYFAGCNKLGKKVFLPITV